MDLPIIEAIYFVNFLTIIATVYFERKKPVNAIAWIFAIILLPMFGFVIYIIFGRSLRTTHRNIFKNKKEYDALYQVWITEDKHFLDSRGKSIADKSFEKYYDIIEMNFNANGSMYFRDNDITIFTSGEEKYTALFKDIENATETIHILYYSINNDDIGRKFIDLLSKKAAEGVKVRLIYDHAANWISPGKMFAPLIESGGDVCSFFPLKFGTYLRFNYRNHRKIAVIDGKYAYMGGMNIGDEYLGLHRRIKPWRDTHIRITGTSVHCVQLRFLMDWYHASINEREIDDSMLESLFPKPEKTGDIGLQLVSGGPDSNDEQIKRGFIKMINSSRKKIYIQTPYFIPDESFLEALQIAATSGVDVRVMLPFVADKMFVNRATTSYIKDLLDYGIKVYLYPGFLHSKMIIMDDEITSIGSSNMDIRSFMLDFEINAFIYSTKFTKKCVNIFENDMDKSKLVTKDWHNSRSLWIKFQEGLFRLFSPML